MLCKSARLDIIVWLDQRLLLQRHVRPAIIQTKLVPHLHQCVIHALQVTSVQLALPNTIVTCAVLATTALKRVLRQRCTVALPVITSTKLALSRRMSVLCVLWAITASQTVY